MLRVRDDGVMMLVGLPPLRRMLVERERDRVVSEDGVEFVVASSCSWVGRGLEEVRRRSITTVGDNICVLSFFADVLPSV